MKAARCQVRALAATLAVALSAGAVEGHELTAAILVAGDNGAAKGLWEHRGYRRTWSR